MTGLAPPVLGAFQTMQMQTQKQTQTQTIAEARELVSFAGRFIEVLRAAEQRLPSEPDHEEERGWLAAAARRVARHTQNVTEALAGAAALPEFEAERQAKAQRLFEAWVDAVEGLAVGISSTLSPNHPLMEILFVHQKFDKLRRRGASAHGYLSELERRRQTSYVVRLSSEPEYAFLPPLLARIDDARLTLEEHERPAALDPEQVAALRHTVFIAADGVRGALHQARSLAEAALSAHPGWFAELGLDAKPRRRPSRAPVDAEPV